MSQITDSRFARLHNDPRFQRVPKEQRKVKIDKRFAAALTDKRFRGEASVDRRGRRTAESDGDAHRFYEVDDDEVFEGAGDWAVGALIDMPPIDMPTTWAASIPS